MATLTRTACGYLVSTCLLVCACGASSTSHAAHTSSSAQSATVQSASLKAGDLPPHIDECARSGAIAGYLSRFSASPDPMGLTSGWPQLQAAGATDGYYEVFSNSQLDCEGFTGLPFSTSSPPPEPTLTAINLVVEFASDSAASADWANPDSYLQQSVVNERGGSNSFVDSTGVATGLGPDSFVATRNSDAAGGIDYVAIWHKGSFEVELITFEIDLGQARRAAIAINDRLS